MTPHLLGELSALLVSNVAGRRANKPRHAVLLHVLTHIDADHQLFIVEEKLRQRPRQFRFPHTCRSEENERADRPLGVGESCAAAPHGIRHALERVILPHNALPQPLFHVHELLRFAFQQPARRNAVHLLTSFAMSSSSTSSFSIGASFCTAENRSCAFCRSRSAAAILP